MALSTPSRQAADEEARAEVEVLNSRLEKTSQLTKRIQASLGRLESNGKSVQDAIGPIAGNTQRLQTLESSKSRLGGEIISMLILADIDAVLAEIDRVRQPTGIKNNEEDVIRKG